MPTGMRRPRTETHAWCCKCERMVPHNEYNKGQAVCRECQKARRRDRYSKGRKCGRCEAAAISDYAPGDYCRKCSLSVKRQSIQPRRTAGPKRYIVITGMYDHPNADARGRIYEHILVMSETLGRSLRPGENVHHKNGVRDDNRPENLELWVTYQPHGQRPEDLIAWAKEILERYEDEVA